MEAAPAKRRNETNVQIEGIGVGLVSAATPFLPVFLTRLGASNLQVGLLTSMPALTGLLTAMLVGRFLQSRQNIIPWFSGSRFLYNTCYAFTGLAPFLVPRDWVVPAVLLIWAFATLPQTMVNVSFSVVMNEVAGPRRRYELMSRRWALLGLTTALAVVAVGQVLVRIDFPINYQIVFLALSLGGLLSLYAANRVVLPGSEPAPRTTGQSAFARLKGFYASVRDERAFVALTAKRFVYYAGAMLAVPLFPLYYVRTVNASDAWIGIISTAQTGVLVLGYVLWARQSRVRGSRFILLAATLGMSVYPVLTALTQQVELIAVYAGLSGLFQAGIDLVFFDQLMQSVPPKQSATFVSVAQVTQYIATVAAPVVGTLIADQIGLGGALIVSGVLRLAAFGLFAMPARAAPEPAI